MAPKKKKGGKDRAQTPGKEVRPPTPPPPPKVIISRSTLLRQMLQDTVQENKTLLGTVAEDCAHEIEDEMLINIRKGQLEIKDDQNQKKIDKKQVDLALFQNGVKQQIQMLKNTLEKNRVQFTKQDYMAKLAELKKLEDLNPFDLPAQPQRPPTPPPAPEIKIEAVEEDAEPAKGKGKKGKKGKAPGKKKEADDKPAEVVKPATPKPKKPEPPKNPLNLPNILNTASPTMVALLTPAQIQRIQDPLNSAQNQKSKPNFTTRAASLAPISSAKLTLAGQLSLQGIDGHLDQSQRRSLVSGEQGKFKTKEEFEQWMNKMKAQRMDRKTYRREYIKTQKEYVDSEKVEINKKKETDLELLRKKVEEKYEKAREKREKDRDELDLKCEEQEQQNEENDRLQPGILPLWKQKLLEFEEDEEYEREAKIEESKMILAKRTGQIPMSSILEHKKRVQEDSLIESKRRKNERLERDNEFKELAKAQYELIHGIHKMTKSPDQLQINVEKRKMERLLKQRDDNLEKAKKFAEDVKKSKVPKSMNDAEKSILEEKKKKEKQNSIFVKIRGHSDPIFNDPRLIQQHTLAHYPDMHKDNDEQFKDIKRNPKYVQQIFQELKESPKSEQSKWGKQWDVNSTRFKKIDLPKVKPYHKDVVNFLPQKLQERKQEESLSPTKKIGPSLRMSSTKSPKTNHKPKVAGKEVPQGNKRTMADYQ